MPHLTGKYFPDFYPHGKARVAAAASLGPVVFLLWLDFSVVEK